MLLHSLSVLLLMSLAACHDRDELITEVFKGSIKLACKCVPYYMCKTSSAIHDAGGFFKIKTKEDYCDNYLEICCSADDELDKPIIPKPLGNPPGCGWRHFKGVDLRITHASDEEAEFGEFPWMVAILREEHIEGNKSYVYQCGGSLIHPKFVLTAAHCVTGKNQGKKFKIRAGEWDTQTTDEIFPHQERDVESIITHEHYRNRTLFNDIALLVLKEPVEIMENVNIICLPPKGQIIDSEGCFATGWGKDVFGKEGKYQVILKKVELSMVPNDKCQELLRTTRLSKFFELHRSFVCAGGIAGRDTCKGDGGGPLVCPIPGDDGRYQQAGIVAWGIGCGANNIPNVYTNVVEFRDWIDKQIQQRQKASS